MKSATRAISAVIISTLLASSALADAPLPAGKPAGAKEAVLFGPSGLVFIGLAVVAIGIGFAISDNGGKNVTTPTTGTGS